MNHGKCPVCNQTLHKFKDGKYCYECNRITMNKQETIKGFMEKLKMFHKREKVIR